MDAKPSEVFSSIKQGLSEALEFAVVSESKSVIRKPAGDKAKELMETDFEHKEDSVETPIEASQLNTRNPL
ncbi:MAG TPA: hypothetical protein DIW64_06800 [Cellvibrio sp.]|nr:hypothetical protein [Cellvibrio sp.]